MNDSHYGLLCAFLLGLGQLCMFTGYDTHTFVVEPVLHSVHDRADSIDAHAGYYGQAVIYVFFTISTLFTPSVLNFLGSKMTLVVGSSIFTLYLCSFLYINSYFFYTTSALLGLGFALFYNAHGVYLTEHSSRQTIERNSAVVVGVGTGCMVLGGFVMLLTTHFGVIAAEKAAAAALAAAANSTMMTSHNSTLLAKAEPRSYREFADSEIRYLFGAFALISFCSNVIFGLIPKASVGNTLDDARKREQTTLAQQIKQMGAAMAHHRLIKLAPLFCLVGNHTTFWLGIYPTTLQFTKSLSGHVYLPALYSIVVGTGDMLMSSVISTMTKWKSNFGQKPTLSIGVGLTAVALGLAVSSTPPMSSIHPNDDATYFIEPSQALSLLIGLLLGMGDACFVTCRTIICAIAMPEARSQAYSVSKFYQSLTTGLLFFLGARLTVPAFAAVLMANCIIALLLFFKVADSTKKMERNATIASTFTTSKESSDQLADNRPTIQSLSVGSMME